MARDQEPLSEEELAAFGEDMQRQAREIREALAEDLGGEPEDYRVDRITATDGGEQ